MPKTKIALLLIILLFLLFPACQIENLAFEKSTSPTAQTNPHQTHIGLELNQIKDNENLKTSLFAALVDDFPQKEEIENFINNHRELLIPSYHFIYTQKPGDKTEYCLAILTKQNLSQTISSLTAPTGYHIKYEHPFLYISTYLNPELISNNTVNSFLAIQSLSTPSIPHSDNTKNTAKLELAIIQNLFEQLQHNLPIHLYYQDGKIIINSMPDSSQTSEAINYVTDFNNSDNIAIKEKLDKLLIDNYLSCEDINLSASEITNININQDQYTLTFKYPDPETSLKTFEQIKTILNWQKKYDVKEKSLPDNTLTFLNLPQSENIDIETNNNQIIYNNISGEKISISLTDQLIIISNQSVPTEPNLNNNSINWNTISQYIPQLENIEKINNINYTNTKNQIYGTIT